MKIVITSNDLHLSDYEYLSRVFCVRFDTDFHLSLKTINGTTSATYEDR